MLCFDLFSKSNSRVMKWRGLLSALVPITALNSLYLFLHIFYSISAVELYIFIFILLVLEQKDYIKIKKST